MSNIYAGAARELMALLKDDLLQQKFDSTNKLIDLVTNKGMHPDEADALLNQKRPDRFKNVKAVGSRT